MTAAADIITYFGVPLAVLGVLPILWNAVWSVRIRRHLTISIPQEARQNVSLTFDPVAGKVLVALDSLELKWPDIFSAGSSSTHLKPVPLGSVDESLIGCSWMRICTTGVKLCKLKGNSQRVVVDASLRFESRGIQCDKQTLTFLALGLGVDPHRSPLGKIFEIEDNETLLGSDSESKIMAIQRSTKRSVNAELLVGCSYSQRRALAWFGIMVIARTGIPMISYVLLASNSIIDRPPSAPILLDIQQIRNNFKDMADKDVGLELSLPWVHYIESVYYGENQRELLPVPQILLKARENAIDDLERLGDEKIRSQIDNICNNPRLAQDLASSLHSICNSRPALVTDSDKSTQFLPSQTMRTIDQCKKTCKNIHTEDFHSSSLVLKNLYQATKPLARPPQSLDLSGNDSDLKFAGQIWLALSIIQLWPREKWPIKRDNDWNPIARPNNEIFFELLAEPNQENKDQKIYIG